MSPISHYENIIKEKRKNTPFRKCIQEIASWYSLSFYRDGNIVSKFPPSHERVRNPVSSRKFHEERDVLTQYAKEYSGDFFRDFSDILSEIPLEALKQFSGTENSEYADIAMGKNIYLTSVGLFSENVGYSLNVKSNCANVYDSVLVWDNCSNVYSSRYVTESQGVFYGQYIHNSHEIWFSSDLIGCEECILCSGLRNAKYAINNKTLSKEEYKIEKEKILKDKSRFEDLYKKILSHVSLPHITNYKSTNVSQGYMNYNIHDSRNVVFVGGQDQARNMYDVISAGMGESQDFYGVMGAGLSTHDVYCSAEITMSSYVYYSYLLESCHHCLGCIGLKNMSYCILNKQYTKDEWEKKAGEIFASLEANGTLGDFFPPSVNPFYFNDTLAYLIDGSFTKDEVTVKGHLWRDDVIRADIPEGMKIVNNTELYQFEGVRGDEWYIDPQILKVVISDEKGDSYRIVKMEYDFLIKYGLPIPRTHWLGRMKRGFKH